MDNARPGLPGTAVQPARPETARSSRINDSYERLKARFLLQSARYLGVRPIPGPAPS